MEIRTTSYSVHLPSNIDDVPKNNRNGITLHYHGPECYRWMAFFSRSHSKQSTPKTIPTTKTIMLGETSELYFLRNCFILYFPNETLFQIVLSMNESVWTTRVPCPRKSSHLFLIEFFRVNFLSSIHVIYIISFSFFATDKFTVHCFRLYASNKIYN